MSRYRAKRRGKVVYSNTDNLNLPKDLLEVISLFGESFPTTPHRYTISGLLWRVEYAANYGNYDSYMGYGYYGDY